MEKFKYAPGIPGYGTTGIDGSNGLNGLGMMFTNLNPDSDQVVITNKIANNQVLWSGISDPLPGDRTFQNGDLFIDSRGRVYEIDFTELTYYRFTGANLTTAQFFTNYATSLTDLQLERYANTHSSFAIDNILTQNTIDYTTSPSRIYKVSPLNFTRIEYCDVEDGNYNAFSAYIGSNSSDNTALAIVRKTADNSFHIGNLNDSEDEVRNVDLVFDVKKLKVTKTATNKFNNNTDSGTVLTNYEIDSNPLFTPNFTVNPASFRISGTSTDISINWNKYDFLNTTDKNLVDSAVATLYVYKKIPYSGNSYKFGGTDISTMIVFNNVESSGWIQLNSLTNSVTYEAYLDFIYNGWSRKSVRLSKTTGVNARMSITTPNNTPRSISADASGYFSSQSSYTYTTDISTNVDWNTTDVAITNNNPVWITLTNFRNQYSNHDSSIGHFDVSISRASSPTTRTSVITISSEYAPDPSILVTQTGNVTNVSLSLDDVASYPSPFDSVTGCEPGLGALQVHAQKRLRLNGLSGMPTNTLIGLTSTINITGNTTGMPTANHLDYYMTISIEKNGVAIYSYSSTPQVATNNTTILYGPWTDALSNVDYNDVIEYVMTVYGTEDYSHTPIGNWQLGFNIQVGAGYSSGDAININGGGSNPVNPISDWTSQTSAGTSHCTDWGLIA